MGWSNGPKTWAELEARLSDGRRPTPSKPTGPKPTESKQTGPNTTGPNQTPGPEYDRPPDGGDSPAWSRKRQPYEPLEVEESSRRRAMQIPYAELHCHSNFSFLDGASHPEELVEEAVRLGLSALGLTDHDGLYGVVRFAEAARAYGLATVFGAELTIDTTTRYDQRVGQPDPVSDHLVVLARNPVGYGRLARSIATSHLAAGEKGAPQLTLEQLADLARGSTSPFRQALRSAPTPEAAIVAQLAKRTGHISAIDGLGVASLADAIDGDAAAITAAVGRHPAAWAAANGSGRPPAHSSDDVPWTVLTCGRNGAVVRALIDDGPRASARELDRLIDAFGRDHVVVEIWDHGDPLDSARNDALALLAVKAGVDVVATNNVLYATPQRRRLATALAAVRARRSLDEVDPWLPSGSSAHLRSGAEMAKRFARYPGAVERAAELALDHAFDLKLVAPNLPPFPCPDGLSEMGYLRRLAEEGAERRYGPRHSERVPGAWAQIDHELALIEHLGFAGYFLVVWDLVEFCRQSNIYAQGRGSAANSAVCFAIGITKADAVSLGLLFERFLSPERDGPPDIDIDIESGRREEVIQYVYARHGRENAAQVANVITYRSRSAIRDMGRALGHPPGRLDAWAKHVDGWGRVARTAESNHHDIPAPVLDLASAVEDFPRHLGIHSGGMVICDRPVVEVCPVEWGRFATDTEVGALTNGETPTTGGGLRRPSASGNRGTPLRTVLQWDKDDCAAAGLVKFDLLGLGMLTALHLCVDLITEHHGITLDLAEIPQDPAVYDMLCQADTVGVFQIESRAQMATLPRLRPRTFYDLVVEIALIRPGPIQGGSVHPYIRRRNGQEPITYLHPLLEKSLGKTLGIPLFQEQLMQISIDVAGFTPAESDQLRQAMGSKRSPERMERLHERFVRGAAERGVSADIAEQLWDKLKAFANYGFPESHSVSFAYLVYSSSWLKHYYPAAFCAGLLNAQPMGFYSPQSLVADARRHGVTVHGPCINDSLAGATLQWPAVGRSEQPSVRLGLSEVRNVGVALAESIVAERTTGGPYIDIGDLVRRTDAPRLALEALATSGALDAVTPVQDDSDVRRRDVRRQDVRRRALWAVGAQIHDRPGHLPGMTTGSHAPPLPGMDDEETMAADLWSTGVTPAGYPTELLRARLDELGVVPSGRLADVEHGTRIRVAGVVTHRQRPSTAGGTTFINLEDETGLINVICSKGVWARYRHAAQGASALLVRGRLERTETVAVPAPVSVQEAGVQEAGAQLAGVQLAGAQLAGAAAVGPARTGAQRTVVINIIADRIDCLALTVKPRPSRDFR
jgi:error-prone DNA polymerase